MKNSILSKYCANDAVPQPKNVTIPEYLEYIEATFLVTSTSDRLAAKATFEAEPLPEPTQADTWTTIRAKIDAQIQNVKIHYHSVSANDFDIMINISLEKKIINSSESIRQDISEASIVEHPPLAQRLLFIEEGYNRFMSRRRFDPIPPTPPAAPVKANAMTKSKPVNPCPLPGHSNHEAHDCIETRKVEHQAAHIAELILAGLQKGIQSPTVENRGRTPYPTNYNSRSRSNSRSNRSRSNSNSNRSRSNSRGRGNYRTRSNSKERGYSLVVTDEA
jgi:hypothetical protein